MNLQKNRAREGANPNLALTLNPETTLNLKAEIMLSDFNRSTAYKQTFDLTKIPSPAEYFSGMDYQFKGHGTWRKTICPFHEDSRPSLVVNMDKGAFKCFACGAKGGDVIAFHQLLHKMSFVDACKDLEAWESK